MDGAGFVTSGIFQEALARIREQDDRMAALDLQQRALNTGELSTQWTFYFQSNKL